MAEDKRIEYSNGEITIIWQPNKCIHAAICVNSLPKVYRPNSRPWIKIENASSEQLIEQIKACPSGALSYKINPGSKFKEPQNNTTMEKGQIAGKTPMMVDLEEGKSLAWCACGKSANQPWCDGSHKGSGISPKVFKAEESKPAAMCMCKQTNNPPFCDGSHSNL